jgi:hypothetical protein
MNANAEKARSDGVRHEAKPGNGPPGPTTSHTATRPVIARVVTANGKAVPSNGGRRSALRSPSG